MIFDAAAFEGSALEWVSDHRRHHLHVDHDEHPDDARPAGPATKLRCGSKCGNATLHVSGSG